MNELARRTLFVVLLASSFIVSAGSLNGNFDAVFLLDNTLSMRASDAQGAVRRVVADFIRQAGPTTKIELAQYDEGVEILIPLRDAAPTLPSIVFKKMNYRGRYANLPAALERAAYDLKTYGRPRVPKAIFVFTDSGIDTGDALRDQTSAQWLREEFAHDAARHDIQIFAVGMSEKADFQLLHALATVTHGDYARADRDLDLDTVLTNLRSQIGKEPRSMVTSKDKHKDNDPPRLSVLAITGKFFLSPIGLACLTVLAGFVAFTVGKQPVAAVEEGSTANVPSDDSPLETELMPVAQMRRTEPFHAHEDFRLLRPFTVVGRVPPLPNGKVGYLRLDSQSIGRCHALIEYRQGSFWVIDKKSRNGTYVNDERVEGECKLQDGDRVRFHHVEFEFVLPVADPDADETLVIQGLAGEETVFAQLPFLSGNDAYNLQDTEVKPVPAGQSPQAVGRISEHGVRLGPDLLLDDDDEQSITRLLSQLNSGPIVDPEVANDGQSVALEQPNAVATLGESTNPELDSLIRQYIGESDTHSEHSKVEPSVQRLSRPS